ncbi:hypothetical protein ACGF5F_29655 [Streptomyces sp. NPDC047821]|uniref:hypothetical protein n=1 Tax=Streptomyces sp. NPDC047821 TaxID=3365488 RepID=UPI00371D062B
MDLKSYLDIAERSGWTGAETALAVAVTSLAEVPVWWAAPLALVLAALKSFVVNKRKAAA